MLLPLSENYLYGNWTRTLEYGGVSLSHTRASWSERLPGETAKCQAEN